MAINLHQIEERIDGGGRIEFDEAMELLENASLDELIASASRIREKFSGSSMSLCTIMNAKSGRCSEDCKFCAQSSHYDTNVSEYPIVSEEAALSLARDNEKLGVNRFSLVTSGRRLSDEEFDSIIRIVERIKSELSIDVCVSLGFLTLERAKRLKDAGVCLYHHNVETSKRRFDEICTTHSYQDKLDTIAILKEVGMPICSGGIFGLGETPRDRLEMIFELRDLGIRNMPLNILSPIEGTPLQGIDRITPDDVMRVVALARIVIPDAEIRYAGGRSNLGDQQAKAIGAGINGLMVGNLLTTLGNDVNEDLRLLREAGFEV
jgi:biotin synthase